MLTKFFKSTSLFIIGVLMMLSTYFGATFTVEAVMPIGIQSYQVEIDTAKGDTSFFRGLMSKELPSENATKVTVEYTVNSSSGGAESFALFRGSFCGISYPEAGTYKKYQDGYSISAVDEYRSLYFEQGSTYKIVYALDELKNITVTKISDNGVSNISMAKEHSFLSEEWQDYDWYFGFGYRQSQSLVDGNKSLCANLSVKCYDDKGKDLGLTFTSLGSAIKIKNAVYTPFDGSLATFDKIDTLLAGGVVAEIDGSSNSAILCASFNPDYRSFVSANSLKWAGAEGSVLKLSPEKSGSPYNNMYRIEFGKPMTKTQIEQGYDLVLNLYLDANDVQAQYINIFSTDVMVADRNNVDAVYRIGVPLIKLYKDGAFRGGFTELTVPNSDLAKIACEDGSISGFTIQLPQAPKSSGSSFDLYLDSAKAIHPAQEIDSEDYSQYENVYSNRNDLIVLNSSENGVRNAVLVVDGVASEETYLINRQGNLVIGEKTYLITSVKVTDGTRVFSKIADNYTVTLNYNDGKTASQTVNIGRDDKFIFSVPPAPESRNGFTFKGWYYGDGTNYTGGVITTATTLYAEWEENFNAPPFSTFEIVLIVSASVIGIACVCVTVYFTLIKKKTTKEKIDGAKHDV